MEKPILFSTPMVQALLNGTKSQTRRTAGLKEINENPDAWECVDMFDDVCDRTVAMMERDGKLTPIYCPYGKPRNLLWVRETFGRLMGKYVYKADPGAIAPGWKPAIHMPRAASRITLETVSIGIERIADISQQDALAEGIGRLDVGDDKIYYQNYSFKEETYQEITPRYSFKTLWQSINGQPKPVLNKRKPSEDMVPGRVLAYQTYPFDLSCYVPHSHWHHLPLHQHVNPWVWVIRFQEVSGA